MKKLLLILGLMLAASPVYAQTIGQNVVPGFMSAAGTNGCPATNACFVPYSVTNPLPVTGGGGVGTDVNISEVDGNPVAAGNGATDSGTLRVTLSNDGTGIVSVPGVATAANQTTGNSSLSTIAGAVGSPIPAGTAIIGKVGIDQTTLGTTNAVQAIPGTTGGLSMYYLTAANSTNAANVKATPGMLYSVELSNNSATLAYVSFYNTSGTPTCGTGIVAQAMIPANSTSGAGWVSNSVMGKAFSSGIGICVTTGIAGTGSVAASAYTISLGYK
jgi:hypothetical protein